MNDFTIIDINPDNVMEERLFCIKDIKNPGFSNKFKWFLSRYSEGMRIKIMKNVHNRQIAFIEYIPAEYAWRPVDADNYMFIHCLFVNSNDYKNMGCGSALISEVESDAENLKMHGVAVMTSKGAWIAEDALFRKNGFIKVDQRGRFELMAKKFDGSYLNPHLIDWESRQKDYCGWHLLYADQCPWHEKSVLAIADIARENEIVLNIRKIESVQEAKQSPSGFGVFALLRDGRLLEDHYLSGTRFKNILKKELNNK